ncbi:MAG: hypothetical protein KDN19_11185 [Verrucomicrobiae bacterium]|nr:hypothetical protein [Verrucomicrobiae bacterium]
MAAPTHSTLRTFLGIAFLGLVVGASSFPSSTSAETAKDIEPGDGEFIRYVDGEEKQQLQTGIVRYVRGDEIVDLVGAVHLADASYFDALNTQLAQYDAVLYEMVGGEFATREERRDEADPDLANIQMAHGLIHSLLGMEYQTEGIDYNAKNFVHADINWEQYQELMTARNQTLATLFQRAMAMAQSGEGPEVLTDEAAGNRMISGLISGFTTGNTADLKRSLAPMLGEAETFINGIEGEDGTVLVTERNKVLMQILDRELRSGHERLAFLYGAGHYPDLERRLTAAGFHRQTGIWMTAWDIKDPEPGEAAPNLWQQLFSDPAVMQGLMDGVNQMFRQLQEQGVNVEAP